MATISLESWINNAMTYQLNAWGAEPHPHGRDAYAWACGFYEYADDLPEDATPHTMAPLIFEWFARQALAVA
ncbi:hypothetical protein JQ596_08550 [Bradyrhizobium manausense]|uniref:hypothetical protein n=1 Tax=Bradyrhizobium manausense TaxID=989370 RepID=UPI001BAC9EAC|nr:hypothetical protein [Bradyrhizobium manausense]MBR0825585.1 hypothetical protein [Bradyrhizobium manausense]